MDKNSRILVDIQNLTVEYVVSRGLLRRRAVHVRVLEDFNLQVREGETLGVVGESGCGKTTLANAIARFIRPVSGQLVFAGKDILAVDRSTVRQQRREIQMVFQNPFGSLDPRMSVLDLVGEPLITHTPLRRAALKQRVEELLDQVGLEREYLHRYPHELSGGQAQRVAFARALALNPKLVLLDEPTSALDVSIQAQIINLLMELQNVLGLTYLFISHSLSLIQHISDRIAVLYLGEVVELGPREAVCRSPRHPYTQALFSSTPVPDPEAERRRIILPGNVPNLLSPPDGCRFHTRCPFVMDRCRIEKPGTVEVEENHSAKCHLLTGR